jgi:hypothetical protein
MEIRERAVAAMKAVSKHATCGKVGNSRSHRREIERLVQWRQRHVTLELMQRLGIEAHRAVELVATIPPDQAFCPLERSRCSLVGK